MTETNIIHGNEIENIFPVTMGELIKMLLGMFEDKVLQVDSMTKEEYTASFILKRSTRLARWLQSKGLGPGDTVSIICENRIEFCLVPCATFLSGITLAPLNPEYTSAELHHTLNLSKPKLVFCSSTTLHRILSVTDACPFIKQLVVLDKNMVSQNSMVVSLDRALQEPFLDALEGEEFIPPELNVEETVATIMCSSGTTGMPKGVMTTQHNLLTFFSILKQVTAQHLQDTDHCSLGLVPFFHSMGFMLMTIGLISGRKIVVVPKFNLRNFLQTIQDYKISILAVPPPVIVLMCQSPLLDEYDLSSIQEVRCGAAPLPQEFEKRICQKFKLRGMSQAYGMTETTLGVTLMPAEAQKVGSVGKIVPGMSAKVVDENGRALGPNSEGELCFKGPLIMKGYVNDPVATANTIDKDGWLHTGDVGYYNEEGYFFIVDRIKELIKYKAYQVAPAELEAILLKHPAVLDSAVIGLPDDKAGELPLGYVVLKPGAKVTAKDIQNFVKDKVSSQKQLRGGVRFVEMIPRNPSGKILRRVLKQAAINPKSKL